MVACVAGSLAFASPLKVVSEREEIAERGSVLRFRVTARDETVLFIPPTQWQLATSTDPQSILLSSATIGATLEIRFAPRADAWRAALGKVHELWPNGVVTEIAKAHTRDAEGRCFEISYAAAGGTAYHSRFAVVSYKNLGVEFTLTAPEGKFGQCHYAWTALLNSFSGVPPGPNVAIRAFQK